MKLSNGTVTFAHLDVVNTAIDFVTTLQRKERVVNYQKTDYLGLKRKIVRSSNISYDDNNAVLSATNYYQGLQKLGQWEMSMEGRVQVGQWFFKSTYDAR
jgi:hypothetical protein